MHCGLSVLKISAIVMYDIDIATETLSMTQNKTMLHGPGQLHSTDKIHGRLC